MMVEDGMKVFVNDIHLSECSTFDTDEGWAVVRMLDDQGELIGKYEILADGRECVTPLMALVRGAVRVEYP